MTTVAARRPVIGIMGAGEPGARTLEAARQLGRLVAEAGWVVLTGGRPAGVMEAASAGAKSVPGSLTIGVLPSGPDGPVSAHVDVALFTAMGDARNAINVLASDVVVACGVEGPGTASEVALALKAGRPTILLAAGGPASAFFRSLGTRARPLEADTPAGVIELIQRRLGIPIRQPEITIEAQMTSYEYAVLIGRDQAGNVGGVTWYLNGIDHPLGGQLAAILNRLGGEGWRVAGLGDLGFDARTEIILMRESEKGR
jgi:uncharacterized protein (TIGR00725 family)